MNPFLIVGVALAGIALISDAKKLKEKKPLTKPKNEGSEIEPGDDVLPQTEEEEISENE